MADDLRRLQATDDANDLREAHAALAEAKDAGTVPLEKVLRKYGLERLLGEPPATVGARRKAKRSRKGSPDRRRS